MQGSAYVKPQFELDLMWITGPLSPENGQNLLLFGNNNKKKLGIVTHFGRIQAIESPFLYKK